MSFHLEGRSGEELRVSSWTWRPTLALLERHRLVSADTIELAGYNGCEATVTAEEARRVADFLDGYLRSLRSDERVFPDGTVTDEPDTGELFRDDLARNYSATSGWLAEFRDFCRSSACFVVG